MRYKAILLDADDTLFDFEAAEYAAIVQLLDRLHINDPYGADKYRRINEACWSDLERGIITQTELRTLRFEKFLKEYPEDYDIAYIAREYETALSEQSFLLPGAYEAVECISRVLPIAIVTNGIARVQHGRINASPIRPFISHLVISEEVGAAKPDPAMIFVALERLGGIAPEEALMVGDSLTSDMRAAERAGVDACWFNPKGKERPMKSKIRYEIRRIEDLANIALD